MASPPPRTMSGAKKIITFLDRELCRSLPRNRPPPCPLWVRSRHSATSERCLLYPRKRTLGLSRVMSALCQKRTFAPSARSGELIVQPDAHDVAAVASPEAIVQANPNDVETIAEGCVE
jgi:hypothetical protein